MRSRLARSSVCNCSTAERRAAIGVFSSCETVSSSVWCIRSDSASNRARPSAERSAVSWVPINATAK